MSKKPADWDAIEQQYRANVLSIRSIAELHDIAESSIRTRAKSKGWTKDISKKVRERAKERLASPEPVNHETENQAIEDSAAVIVHVVREHQSRIKRFTNLLDSIEINLSESVDNNEVPMNIKAASCVSLVNALDKLIQLERQAFNVDDAKTEKTETLEDILDFIDSKNNG